MKISKILFFIFLFTIVFTSCENTKINDNIIKDNMILELRKNNRHEKGKLKIIKNDSKAFQKLKSYFNNLQGFKKIDYINTYPNVIILGENIKISITGYRVYVEYKNSRNQIIKLTKKTSLDEFPDLQHLTRENNWVLDLGNIYGVGDFKTGEYMECGLAYQKIKYQYKVGKWKFWNLNRKLIAEGEFEIDSAVAVGRGGCDFEVKMSKLNKDKWTFYNQNGKEIEPTIEQQFRIENAGK